MKKIVRLTENDLRNIIIEAVIDVMDNASMEDYEDEDFSYRELARHPENDFPELSLTHRPPFVPQEPLSAQYTEVGIPENSEVVYSVDALGLKVFLCHGEYGDYYKIFKAVNKTGKSSYLHDIYKHRAITFKTGDCFAPANHGKYVFTIQSVDAPFVLDTDNGKVYIKGYDQETEQWEYMEASEVFQ